MSSEDVHVHDPYFAPIVQLPDKVEQALEEDEVTLFKMRAKLFRWASEAEEPMWKERGTGDVKLLEHKTTKRIRLLMRRDKTFKTCANHYLDRNMTLKPNPGSERSWMWTVLADFAEEELKKELFAIRFLNAENANKFKEKFCECQQMLDDVKQDDESSSGSEGESEETEEKKADSEEKGGETEESDEKKGAEDERETVAKQLEELSVTGDSAKEEAKPNTSLEDSPEK